MSIDAILSTRIKEPKVEEIKAVDSFENLGFIKIEKENTIIYVKKHKHHTNKIIFDTELKTFKALTIRDEQITPYPIKMTVLSAIQKQIKELGWHIV